MIGLLKKINGLLKGNYHWLVLTVFVAAYLYYEFLYQISEKEETTGEVISLRGRSEIVVRYYVGNVEFIETKRLGLLAKYLKQGERYIVSYDSKKPRSARIKFQNPVITGDSLFVLTTSLTCELVGLGNEYLRYSYSVDEQTFERIQLVENAVLSKDRRYQIAFNKLDPTLSYICLDSLNCWR
ncbi:MAG: hypothetical protein JSU09_06495 [Bacteroidetes bacterium]|nr:hypothetical protein [Bacteroidota bacterium]